MLYAKQSTAIIVTVGPVLDATGVAVTDGVVGDFKISKNGGAPAALNGSATLTHRATGHYSLSLTATDVNTVGTAEVIIDDTVNACPIKEIQVVETAVYDALFADAAVGYVADQPVNVTKWLGTAAATPTVAGVPVVDVTHWRGTATAVPGTAGVPSVDTIRFGTTVQTTGKNVSNLVDKIVNSWHVDLATPAVIEVPASGTRTYRAECVMVSLTNGVNIDDSSGPGVPTLALINQAGTSLASRLGTVTRISTGRYRVIYTSTAGDADAGLVWTWTTQYGGFDQITTGASIVQAERAAIPTAAVNASTLLATELYTGWSITRAFKKMLSMLVGKTSGLTSGAGTYVVKDPTDAATEETFTVTADGNRTSSTHA